jgi:pimeloyl-ACP methyl ester carboxylesterase
MNAMISIRPSQPTPSSMKHQEACPCDFQRIAERLATAIPGARRQVIPGSGHLLPVEKPSAFAAAVLAFLDDIPGR